ncbi:MAG: benenodin family lasso peptide [Sphingomonas sp.]|nr:benenodin family lasso peptide [Sphingomonas sp.]MDK2769708.1 benenodin family lasso peptide [Sphingomonas sp.]
MKSEEAQVADLIDLGAASVETQGSCTGMFEIVGYILPEGLSDN